MTTDLNLNFLGHPETGDLIMLKGKAAVFQTFKTLVLSGFGDYLMDFSLEGGDVTRRLFENNNVLTRVQIQKKIEEIARLHEPRITIKNVEVSSPDQYTLSIVVQYLYESEEEITSGVIALKRNS